MFDLRSWLRRTPQPDKLRITTREGEERTIDLPKGRKRWANIEETVRTSGAASVQCLDDKGEILRAQRLTEEEIDADDDRDGAFKHDEKVVQRALAAQAQMLDRYGARMNDAFDRGASAASVSQDKLVELVETLTHHLTLAITNLHTLGVNLANAVQAQGAGGGDGEGNMLQGIMALVAAGRGVPMPSPDPNGKAKKP